MSGSLRAVETTRHRLQLVVRIEDHFAMAPFAEEVRVDLDTGERGISARGSSMRHDDGTYRFHVVEPGARQITVTPADGRAFTWTATTAVAIPRPDPAVPVVIEVWPTPKAAVPAGVLAIRGRLVPQGAAPPIAPAQEVQIEAVGIGTPRNRRTRCEADGEFVFVVHGATELTTAYEVELDVTVPGRGVASIEVSDAGATTTFVGSILSARPGREVRAVIAVT